MLKITKLIEYFDIKISIKMQYFTEHFLKISMNTKFFTKNDLKTSENVARITLGIGTYITYIRYLHKLLIIKYINTRKLCKLV